MSAPLYKTTLVIWSEFDPTEVDIDELAYRAMNSDAYCSTMTAQLVEKPEQDKDWDGTEFFEAGELAPSVMLTEPYDDEDGDDNGMEVDMGEDEVGA